MHAFVCVCVCVCVVAYVRVSDSNDLRDSSDLSGSRDSSDLRDSSDSSGSRDDLREAVLFRCLRGAWSGVRRWTWISVSFRFQPTCLFSETEAGTETEPDSEIETGTETEPR